MYLFFWDMTWDHIPEEWIPHAQWCKNLRTPIFTKTYQEQIWNQFSL